MKTGFPVMKTGFPVMKTGFSLRELTYRDFHVSLTGFGFTVYVHQIVFVDLMYTKYFEFVVFLS